MWLLFRGWKYPFWLTQHKLIQHKTRENAPFNVSRHFYFSGRSRLYVMEKELSGPAWLSFLFKFFKESDASHIWRIHPCLNWFQYFEGINLTSYVSILYFTFHVLLLQTTLCRWSKMRRKCWPIKSSDFLYSKKMFLSRRFYILMQISVKYNWPFVREKHGLENLSNAKYALLQTYYLLCDFFGHLYVLSWWQIYIQSA